MRALDRLCLGLTLLGTVAAGPAVAAPVGFADEVLADSPFAYWRFGEAAGATTAIDSSGNGHHGAYSGGVAPGQGGLFGGDGGALFGGVDGRVSVPNAAQLGPDFLSMEALVRWDGGNGFQQRVLEKSFFGGGEQASYGLSILDDGRIQVEYRAGGGPSIHTTLLALGEGDAAHIVATFDGANVFVYVDGVLVLAESIAFPGALQDGLNALGLGNQTERNRPFNGLIDEIALYNYALSEERVREHYEALQAVPEPGTLALFAGGALVLAAAGRRARPR
jgi:hypothetical protein